MKLLHPFIFVPFLTTLDREEWDIFSAPGHARFQPNHLSGTLQCSLVTVTKLCLKTNFQSLAQRDEAPYIPGSSIKGMVRNVMQVLGEGCAGRQFADKKMEEVEQVNKFKLNLGHMEPCTPQSACMTCQLFGYSWKKPSGDSSATHINDAEPFGWAGKVCFLDSDPIAQWSTTDWVPLNRGAYRVENWPKARPTDHGPRHLAFYFPDGAGKSAGWKVYRHAHNIREVDESAGFGSDHCVRGGTVFRFGVQFENLTPEEYATFCLALTLKHACPEHQGDRTVNLVHKIGYGKGVGLGSCEISIDKEEFLSPGRFLGITSTPPNKPSCGLRAKLERNSFADFRAARTRIDAADLLLYPSRDWFDKDKTSGTRSTVADFDGFLLQKPPKVRQPEPSAPPPQPGALPLPVKVRVQVTSIKSNIIKAKTLDSYNGKAYWCELKGRWGMEISKEMELIVFVKPGSENHAAGTFAASRWTA